MSILESSQQRRKGRINIVLNIIKSMETVEIRQLIGILSVNHGFKTELSKQYIRELKDAGYLNLKDGLIFLTENHKKQIGLIEVKK